MGYLRQEGSFDFLSKHTIKLVQTLQDLDEQENEVH